MRTALLRITHGSPSQREARTPTAPAGHLLAAPRRSAACGHGIAADKGNSLVRHARTAHRAAAHYAWLTLREGGENSHRRGFAAPPPSKREASYNHSRKEATPPPAPYICAYLRFCGKSEGGDTILLPPIAAKRKHAVSRRRVRGLSLRITRFLFVSSKRNL